MKLKKFGAIIALVAGLTFSAKNALAKEDSAVLQNISMSLQRDLALGKFDKKAVADFVRVLAKGNLHGRGVSVPLDLVEEIEALNKFYYSFETFQEAVNNYPSKRVVEEEFLIKWAVEQIQALDNAENLSGLNYNEERRIIRKMIESLIIKIEDKLNAEKCIQLKEKLKAEYRVITQFLLRKNYF